MKQAVKFCESEKLGGENFDPNEIGKLQNKEYWKMNLMYLRLEKLLL